MILKPKIITELPVQVGDILEVFQNKEHQKLGEWCDAKSVVSKYIEDKKISQERMG